MQFNCIAVILILTGRKKKKSAGIFAFVPILTRTLKEYILERDIDGREKNLSDLFWLFHSKKFWNEGEMNIEGLWLAR